MVAKKSLIFIIGKNGQLAKSISKNSYFLSQKTYFYSRKKHKRINLFHLKETILKKNPKILINVSAIASTDYCEKNKKDAYHTNYKILEYLGKNNLINKIPLIHISTDFVHDGKKINKYSENDKESPINYYGYTKLLGEHIIKSYFFKYIILRTSWLISKNGKNFYSNFVSNKNFLNIVSDQFGTPTFSENLSSALAVILKNQTKKKIWNQIFNFSGDKKMSWYQLAIIINRELNLNRKINPIRIKDLNLIAKRPKNTALNCNKFYKFFNVSRSRLNKYHFL